MIRLSSLFWLALVLISGFAMFKVKYAVQDLDDELGRVRKQTVAEQQEIRVLNAEWAYLTQPERLAELNRKFLSLAPIPTKQLQRGVNDIPLRPPAPPPLPTELAAAAPMPETTPAAPMPETTPPVLASDSGQPPLSLDQLVDTVLAPANAATRPVMAKIAALTPTTTPTTTPTPPVRLTKASTAAAPRTLDDLLAQIDGDR
jgi:cell division protein FtsL